MSATAYEGWAVVELMGHRERPGRVSEVEMYGGKLLRIDIPGEDGVEVTEFYGVTSIYALRPTSEEVARDRAKRLNVRPVRPVEYAQLAAPSPPASQAYGDGYEDSYDDEDNY
jgi:hypothetical protein